jgi:hypothetical protein
VESEAGFGPPGLVRSVLGSKAAKGSSAHMGHLEGATAIRSIVVSAPNPQPPSGVVMRSSLASDSMLVD